MRASPCDSSSTMSATRSAASGSASARAASAIAQRRRGSARRSRSTSRRRVGELRRPAAAARAAPRSTRYSALRGLVVVDRLRERHQHAADARGAQFGERQRAGAADHEVGPGVGGGHVGDEGLDARGDAGLAYARVGVGAQLLAALVAHFDASTSVQRRQRLRHRRVQRARALAAAEHQQAQRRRRARRSAAAGGGTAAISLRTGLPTTSSRRRRSVCGKPVSTRRAKRASTRLVRPGARFCSCTSSGMPASRAARPPGPAAIAAEADHRARLALRAARARAARTARSTRNGAPSSVAMPLPRTPLHRDGVDRRRRAAAPGAFPCRRRRRATSPARRARAARARPRGPGRCGRRCRRRGSSPDAGRRCAPLMRVLPSVGFDALAQAAGAAHARGRGGRGSGCAVAGTLPGDGCSASPRRRATWRSRAIEFVGHAQQQAERRAGHQHARAARGNQRQRQALGRQQAEVHADRHEALQARSTARRRTRSSRRSGGASRRTAARSRTRDRPAARTARSPAHTPTKPSSSAITARMKSVCASGRYDSFCTDAPRPTPNHSPRPTAISALVSW